MANRDSKGRFVSRDHGADALLRRLKTAGQKTELRVGILAGDVPHGGVSVFDVGTWMEFGTVDADGNEIVPARSFIRAWYDETIEANKRVYKLLQARMLAGELTQEQVFGQLGSLMVGQIQRRISEGIPPELQSKTIERKGSSTPLIDTGQLRASVTFEVV